MFNFQLDYLSMSFDSEGLKVLSDIDEAVDIYNSVHYIKPHIRSKLTEADLFHNNVNKSYNAIFNDVELYEKVEEYLSLISPDLRIYEEVEMLEENEFGLDTVDIISLEISRVQAIISTAFETYCDSDISFLFVKLQKPLLGHKLSYQIIASEPNGRHLKCGFLHAMNASKQESFSIVFSGELFSLIKRDDYSVFSFLHDSLKCSIARIDIALDDYKDHFSFDFFVKSYKGGMFNYHKNRALKSSTVGDWLTKGSPLGRTFYMGSRTSEKFLRMYEKGKQKGDETSKWVRYELELKPKSLVVDSSIFTNYRDVFLNAFKNFDTYFGRLKTENEFINFERKKAEEQIEDEFAQKCRYLFKTYGETLIALRNSNLLDQFLDEVNLNASSKPRPFRLTVEYVFDAVSKCIKEDSKRKNLKEFNDKLKKRNLRKALIKNK